MRTLLLSTAILVVMLSSAHAQSRVGEQGLIKNDGPSMTTGDILGTWMAQAGSTSENSTHGQVEHVQEIGTKAQRITPAPDIGQADRLTQNTQTQLPSWEQGYGWDVSEEEADPPVDIFQVAANSWGSQALAELEKMRTGDVFLSDTGEQVHSPAAIGPDVAQQWESSILAAEQRLIERLIKARTVGEKYLIWVNLPAYKLRVLDTHDGSIVMESRVIIGKPSRRTPRMDTRIVNLKFNPDWTPPKSSPGSRYTPSGPSSPLGRVRFSADNGIGIYLHDTNRHDLFDTTTRAYSLGCVRVEQWRDLVKLLSGEDDAWIDHKTRDWKIRWVDTSDVTAFLDYQRIDFDDNGVLTQAPDIYRMGDKVK